MRAAAGETLDSMSIILRSLSSYCGLFLSPDILIDRHRSKPITIWFWSATRHVVYENHIKQTYCQCLPLLLARTSRMLRIVRSCPVEVPHYSCPEIQRGCSTQIGFHLSWYITRGGYIGVCLAPFEEFNGCFCANSKAASRRIQMMTRYSQEWSDLGDLIHRYLWSWYRSDGVSNENHWL
jgi:hypothetical protein